MLKLSWVSDTVNPLRSGASCLAKEPVHLWTFSLAMRLHCSPSSLWLWPLTPFEPCARAGGWFRNLLTRTKTNDSQELPEALEVPVEPPFLPPEAEQPGLQTMKDL